MDSYSVHFEGSILNRGFWLYIIDIRAPTGRHIYVGRTGDSSSANAGSPFSRIGQHLDLRANAKGNALLRNLRAIGVDARRCRMELTAMGPLFPEVDDFAAHRLIRDQIAALEKGVAVALRAAGFAVIGNHSASVEPDLENLRTVLAIVFAKLYAAA